MSTCAQVRPFPAQCVLEMGSLRRPLPDLGLARRSGAPREARNGPGNASGAWDYSEPYSNSTRSALQRALPWMLSRRLSRSVRPLSGSIKCLRRTYASLPSKLKGKPADEPVDGPKLMP